MKIDCDIRNSSIKYGIILVLIFIVFLLAMAYTQRLMFITAHKDNLMTLAESKANQINTFLKSQKEKLSIIASIKDFKNALLISNDPSIIDQAKKRINDLKNIIPGISVMNSKGIVVIGDIDQPGTDYGFHPYFLGNRTDTTFTKYYDEFRKNNYFAVIGPVYDDSNNIIIGRIAFDLELDQINNLMNESLEDNTSIHLIDPDGFILGGSGYVRTENNKELLSQINLDDGAKFCLDHLKKYGGENGMVEKHEKDIIQYVNYKNIKVFGSHAYAPNISGCIIAEQNEDHVLKYSMLDYIQNVFNPYITVI